jgi:hypothetical protein
MITTIPLRISGDTWYNPQEFQAELEKLQPDQFVLIDINSEGPALNPYGIYSMLSQYPCNYIFTRWSNPIEYMPYGRAACSELSHFFKLSQSYWINEIPNTLAPYVFGLFVGRNSVSRNCILYDSYHLWQDKFLLSKMHSKDNWPSQTQLHINIDIIAHWASAAKQEKIKQWWAQHPIRSIDNKGVHDQYHNPEQSSTECALSLLSHYGQFNFELICETYTLGDTFFPTEKTVRPIAGNKPFLIHGPKHFLRNLQNLGFKTFSGLWNEQYDNYEGPARWEMMKPIINMICNWDNETRSNVLTQCASITSHNRNRLKEIVNDNKRI